MSFSAFSFCMFVTLTVLFLFLGASLLCVHNNLKRTADLNLWSPDKTSVCYTHLALKWPCSVHGAVKPYKTNYVFSRLYSDLAALIATSWSTFPQWRREKRSSVSISTSWSSLNLLVFTPSLCLDSHLAWVVCWINKTNHSSIMNPHLIDLFCT